VLKVEFEGTTGNVAFDQFGQRRSYQLDVLEQRGDRDNVKVRLSSLFFTLLSSHFPLQDGMNRG